MNHLNSAQEVFEKQIAGVRSVQNRLDQEFNLVIKALSGTTGRVVLCGIGKSGLIAQKISATLSSTGTPSFFLHPAEALHGDLGMIKQEDVVILVSYSGETSELLKLVPYFQKYSIKTISVTGNRSSSLSRNTDLHIDVNVSKEACPINLAPTTSTTATLILGDAIAVCLMKERNTTAEDFARFHPGGSLGRNLLGIVADEMVPLGECVVSEDLPAEDVVSTMTKGIIGFAVVKIDDGYGVITDGDLRRAMKKHKTSFFELTAYQLMTRDPVMVSADTRLVDAEQLMLRTKTHALLVERDGQLVGVLKK